MGNLGWSSRFGRLLSASSLLLLAMCRQSGARSAGEPESCTDRVAELEKWIVKYPTMENVLVFGESGDGPDTRMVDQDSPRVERDRGSPSIEMTPRTLRLGGSQGDNDRGTDIEHAREWLKSAAALKPGGRTTTPPLLLAIDRDRPWAEIVSVADAAAAAGFTQLDFVFVRPYRIAPPPSSVDEQARRIRAGSEPFQRTRTAVQALFKAAEPCRATGPVLSHMAGVDPREKVNVLAAELPAALRECKCDASPRDLMTFLWTWADPDKDGVIRREFIGARVTLAKGKQPATVVQAARTARWSDVSRQVVAAVNPAATAPAVVRFAVTGK